MMRGMERKKAKRRPRRVAEKARPAPAAAAAVAERPPAPGGAGLLVALETPEPIFATRVPPPVPERRRPTTRHAIFFDVENTSHPGHIERVIERLAHDAPQRERFRPVLPHQRPAAQTKVPFE